MYDTFITADESTLICSYSLESVLYSDSLSFYLVSFLWPKVPSQTRHYIGSSCLLRFLLAVTVSQTLLVFDDLDSSEDDCSDILEEVPLLGCAPCFSDS